MLLLLAGMLLTALFVSPGAEAQTMRPNVVLILADDLGYGDLGVYGAPDIRTPNIDQISLQGVRATNFYATPSCATTRATLMTGSYNPRVTMSRNPTPSANVGLHQDEVTLGELLQGAGYATGIFGKWHLGDHFQYLPLRHGFNTFYGIPYSNNMWPFHPRTAVSAGEDPRLTAARQRAQLTGYASSSSPFPPGEGYPNLPLLDNDSIVSFNPDQAQMNKAFVDETIRFIEANRNGPFFAYLALAAPHVPLHPAPEYIGRSARGLYGDAVEEMDAWVGRVMQKLTDLGIDSNTLVIFLSDNGPWREYGIDGGSTGGLRGSKEQQFEGGIRVPALFRWPGSLGSGRVVSESLTIADIYPTVASVAGTPLPSGRVIDGVNAWSLLNGSTSTLSRQAIFGFVEGEYTDVRLGSMRSGKWKLHVKTSATGTVTPTALYDLTIDPGETVDVRSSQSSVVNTMVPQGQSIVNAIRTGKRPLGTVSYSGEPFAERPGIGDIISIEAENYHVRTARGGQNWQPVSLRHSAFDQSMQALPNNNAIFTSNYAQTSPQLEYRILPEHAGRYYVWVRARGASNSDDSLHVGLNGQAVASGERVDNIGPDWGWTSSGASGRIWVDIPAPGQHTLDVWMREDGVIIDKLILTRDPLFLPYGKGQVESRQVAAQPLLKFSTGAVAISVNQGETAVQTRSVTLGTSDGSVANYTITSNAPWLTTTPTGGTTPSGTITLRANPAGLAAGQYVGTVTANAPGYVRDTIDVTLTVVGASSGFSQDPATGLVSIEAENFDTNTPQGSHSWTSLASSAASGGNAMESTPNTGANINTGYVTTSPRLNYVINFTQVGTHYIWIRGRGPTSSDDSVHIGLNGAGPSTSDRITGWSSAGWTWSDETMDGPRATITVSAPGEQVLNLWMREDGTQVDKILLTTSATLVPTSFGSTGPPESPRGAPQPALQFSRETAAFSASQGSTTLQTTTATLGTSNGGAANFSLSSNAAWLTTVPTSGSTPSGTITLRADPTGLPAGQHVGTITASAQGFVSDTIGVTLTVLASTTGYQQDAATGLVSIEVENFDANTPQGSHAWTPYTSGSASGGNGLAATPNSGVQIDSGIETSSPRLGFRVNFTRTGTHYLWVRGWGPSGNDDSLHAGLNNTVVTTADRITGFSRTAWSWTDQTMDGPRATINVTAPGEQLVNLWMREDGMRIDKIVLTTSASLVPTSFGSTGPPESPRGPAQQALEFSQDVVTFSVDAGETALQTRAVTLGTSNNSAASYSITSNAAWLTTTPTGGTTPSGTITLRANPTGLAPGQYVGTVTASAAGYTSDTIDVTLTVLGSSSGFRQDPVTGLVSIELEHFDANTPRGTHSWGLLSNTATSGGTAMEARPNTGANIDTGYVTTSPQLDFVVNFTQVGTHYIWIRGRGSSTDDSVHVGLNGTGPATSDRITGWSSSGWKWSNETMDAPRATIEVTVPGDQVLNLWMREDGTQVDKIVLTTSSSLVPTSLGPPESPRGSP